MEQPRTRPLPRYIVIGQRVEAEKVARSRELRSNMTDAERVLWRYLRANRMRGLQFRRQQIISGFIVDFFCHTAGLVIEVDGVVHEQQTAYDEERECILASRGLTTLRFTNDEVQHRTVSVLDRIATWIDAHECSS